MSAVPRHMSAMQIDRFGGPEVMVRREVSVRPPGAGEVLVRLSHSGINFMDIHARQGKYERSRTYPMTLPLTLGMEGAGEVADVGWGVDGLRIGDRVAFCLVWGSYADYAVIPADRAVPIPPGVGTELAAASLFHALTAHYLCHDVGQLAPGRTCLIHAASGGIGQLLVQMAKQCGAIVFATASTDEKRAVAKQRGADFALPYHGLAEQVRDATSGRGVDVVFDPIGRDTLRGSFRATRKKGLVVAFGSVSGSVSDLDPIELGEAGSLFLTRPRLADHLAGEMLQQRAADVFAQLDDGRLTVDISGRYGPDEVWAAHASLTERSMLGKPILLLNPA